MQIRTFILIHINKCTHGFILLSLIEKDIAQTRNDVKDIEIDLQAEKGMW